MSKDTTLANQIINESIRGYVENSISTSASAISRDNQENTTLPPSYKRSDLSIDTTSLGNEYTKYITTYYETEKYSITPGTFDSRDFVVPSTRPDLDYYIAAVGAQVQNQNIKGQDLATELNSNISSIEKLSESIIDIALDATSQQDIDLDEIFIATSESAQKWLTDLQRYKAFTDALPINTQNTDAADTAKLNLLSFKDQYSNGSSIVTRFGISLATLSDHEIQDLLSTQQNLDTNLQERSVAQSPDTATQQNSRNTNDGINKILYPLEVLRIKDAIDFLTNYVSNDTSNDTTDDLSKDRNNYTGPNASLVDIFARNDDGSVKIIDNFPKIHTIVLFKELFFNDTNTVVIIDPSNPDFSSHITLPANLMRLSMLDNDIPNIISPLKEKIYTSPDKYNIGPKPDQYRDCIDISVKIAFGLNKLPQQEGSAIGYSLDNIESSIMSLDAIQEVSNQPSVNQSLFFESTEAIARIRQASSDIVREKSNKLLKKFDTQIEGVKFYTLDALDVAGAVIEHFSKYYNSLQYDYAINSMTNLYRENGELLMGYVIEDEEMFTAEMRDHNTPRDEVYENTINTSITPIIGDGEINFGEGEI